MTLEHVRCTSIGKLFLYLHTHYWDSLNSDADVILLRILIIKDNIRLYLQQITYILLAYLYIYKSMIRTL